MKAIFLGLLVSVFLAGCGQDDNNPPGGDTMNNIRGIIKATFPAMMTKIDKIDVEAIPEQFQNLVEMGVVSAQDAETLQDPYNQQVLMDVLRLLKGSKSDQEVAVRLTAAGGPCEIVGILKTISTVLQAAAPFLAAINPAIGGVIQVVASVIPVAISVIEQIFQCTVAMSAVMPFVG